MRCLIILIFWLSYFTGGRAFGLGKTYEIDFGPLQADPQRAAQYKSLQEKFQTEALSPAEHKLRMDILQATLLKHPDWLDGYWLRAADAFFLGSMVTNPADHPQARLVLVEGESSVDECLRRQKDHLLCKFFKASLQAKIASLDGIFASLRRGQAVRDIWLEVVKSGVDLTFRPNVSLQGSAYYGLGLFYRLVPNFFLMDWLFSIRGNIDESIRYHREAMKYDLNNPCYHLMLSASLLCKVKGNPQTKEFQEAIKLLDQPIQNSALDLSLAVCVQDMPKIKAKPDHTCGYTQAKYQDEVKESDFKK
ncbi:MAG: hypothetical protein NTX25_04600 [Proteobacteria bacterium]|nr:hypothetical protein [Pseudomonadota bacterium]